MFAMLISEISHLIPNTGLAQNNLIVYLLAHNSGVRDYSRAAHLKSTYAGC